MLHDDILALCLLPLRTLARQDSERLADRKKNTDVPVLGEKGVVGVLPGQTRASVSHHAHCDLGSDIQRENALEGHLGTICDSYAGVFLLEITMGPLLTSLKLTFHFLDIVRPVPFQLGKESSRGSAGISPLQFGQAKEVVAVELDASQDLLPSSASMLVSNLAGGRSQLTEVASGCWTYLVWRPRACDFNHGCLLLGPYAKYEAYERVLCLRSSVAFIPPR